jgi:hypothetical protein
MSILDEKMKTTTKPIFPVLPSVYTAAPEIGEFISKGRIFFRDEVALGNALSKVYSTHPPFTEKSKVQEVNHNRIRNVINQAQDGYISPGEIRELLDASGIPQAGEAVVTSVEQGLPGSHESGWSCP